MSNNQPENISNKKTLTITRKIEIGIVEENEVKRKEQYDYLHKIRYDVFRAANSVVNNQFFNLLYSNRVREEVGARFAGDEEKKTLLAKANEIAKEFYGTSVQNTTYQIISKEFPDMPSSVKSALNSVVTSKFNSDVKHILAGKRTVSNYKLGMPIPFNLSTSIRFYIDEQDKTKYYLNWINGIKFYLRFGKDRSGNQVIIDRILADAFLDNDNEIKYKFCDSSICYNVEKNRWFLLLVVRIPKDTVRVDYKKYAATNLGMNCPIYLTTSDGKQCQIGNREDFLNVRLQMKERYSKLQEKLTTALSGHGRKRKLKALDRLKLSEKNFAKTYNHKLSKEIIKYCVENGIGNIVTEDLLGSANKMNKSFVLRFWGYHQLQEMISYKASRMNINVIKRNPANITIMCNCCKTVNADAVDVKKRVYVCSNEECDKYQIPVDVDLNASLNMHEAEEKPGIKKRIKVS